LKYTLMMNVPVPEAFDTDCPPPFTFLEPHFFPLLHLTLGEIICKTLCGAVGFFHPDQRRLLVLLPVVSLTPPLYQRTDGNVRDCRVPRGYSMTAIFPFPRTAPSKASGQLSRGQLVPWKRWVVASSVSAIRKNLLFRRRVFPLPAPFFLLRQLVSLSLLKRGEGRANFTTSGLSSSYVPPLFAVRVRFIPPHVQLKPSRNIASPLDGSGGLPPFFFRHVFVLHPPPFPQPAREPCGRKCAGFFFSLVEL